MDPLKRLETKEISKPVKDVKICPKLVKSWELYKNYWGSRGSSGKDGGSVMAKKGQSADNGNVDVWEGGNRSGVAMGVVFWMNILGLVLNWITFWPNSMNKWIFKTNRPLLVEAEGGLSNGQIFQVVFVCLLTWLFNRLPLKVEHLRC